MKAVIRTQYGDTSVLRVADVDEPPIEAGRVIVSVAAAGVNMAEWHLMSGSPSLVRLAMGIFRPRQTTLGQDVAGVVTAVGPGVTRFAVGDAVFGSGRGSWATLASVREDLLHPLPPGISAEDAASIPMAGYTALQALRLCGPLDGIHLAVTGAGGGVGSSIVQLAVARGARVTAVCSGAKESFVRSLGAHEVIDYTTTDPTAGERRFDAVLDFAGGLPIRQWKRVITPNGVLVLGGAENGGAILGPLGRSLRAPLTRGIRVRTLMAAATGSDLAELAGAVESGALRPVRTQTYSFAEAARAVDDLRSGVHPGKIVLIP